MPGKHRSSPKKDTTSRMVRLPTSKDVHAAITRLADQEQRSYGNMVNVLIKEALIARREI